MTRRKNPTRTKAIEPADKTQHGDPIPETVTERQGNELTPDELVGKSPLAGAPSGYMPSAAQRTPVTTGPIASTKVCAECRSPVGIEGICQKCAKGLKVPTVGGVNSIDRTMPAQEVSRTFNYAAPYVRT